MLFSDLKESVSQLLFATHRDLVSEPNKGSAASFLVDLLLKLLTPNQQQTSYFS